MNDHLHEAKDEQDLSSKKAIVSFIAANLMRFVNKPDGDEKGLIMLVAALSVLNMGEDSATINIARRLATAALVAKSKSKD